MTISASLCALFVLCYYPSCTQSFSNGFIGRRVQGINTRAVADQHQHPQSQSQSALLEPLFLSTNANADNNPRPTLVDQKLFESAIATAEKANGQLPADTDSNPDQSYAIGRLKIILAIPPGIDMVETPELVLVNGVTQTAFDAGIKPLDTIVGVSTIDGAFQESTMVMNLDDTFRIISMTIAHARENGQDEIEVEVNRLLKGYYK
mmetsp:Transcript_6484/g.9483  ORF Transcript_6484/g.9483 Transcript_6484/m.9483 type:complete len:206 (+) Transcript_6484:69-686(+)